MTISVLIYLMVFMPMAGAFVSYLIGRQNKKARDYFVSALTILEFVFAVLEFLQHDFLAMIFDLIAGVFGTWYDRESMKEKEKSEEQKTENE